MVAVGVHVEAGKFPACTTRSSAFAVCPGDRVTTVAEAAVDRVADAPTWLNDVPVPMDTPGYPNSVHAADPVFVKSMFM